jgi:hypothetical protein
MTRRYMHNELGMIWKELAMEFAGKAGEIHERQ